ncbi:MAG TPA: site-2 protease family protein [Caldilineae bacterium]|nr:site-2 protease family protein [Caldilineae bacterium]
MPANALRSAKELTLPIDTLVQGRMTEELKYAVDGYFEIESIRFDVPILTFQHGVRLSGRFLGPTDVAYDAISERARPNGYLIFFRKEDAEQVIYAAQGTLPKTKPRWRLAGILFVATVLSVFITYGLTADLTIDWRLGLGYAVPLMTILLAHELGHFFVARRNRMAVSPPYFIPLPIISLGTLGAVIVMRTPPKNRKKLLQMGAAGPLAGLVFAIPILWYGLSISYIGHLPVGESYMLEGNSLLYAGLKWLQFGRFLPAAGLDVMLSPVAFAGWVGLLVTALNLIPAGQLDGGHAAYTLFGPRIRWFNYVLIAILLALSFRFTGWLIWVGLLILFGWRHAVPMDDITPLDGKHKALAILLLLLAVLLFMPSPMTIVNP